MTIPIVIKADVANLTRQLNGLERQQIPFATAHALTMTAKRVQAEEELETRAVFDRPTPFTLGAFYTKPATKENLSAHVWIKSETVKGTPAEKYLKSEIEGGERRLKKFEVALRSVGALPDGYFTVPGDGAKIDAYGNMDKGQIVQLLSYFQAFPDVGYRANVTSARKGKLRRGTKRKQGTSYFVGTPADGKLPLGIWQRTHFASGTAIRPILLFVQTASYQKRLDFYGVAERTIQRDFERQMQASLTYALATAK